jgi:hypothetical protein
MGMLLWLFLGAMGGALARRVMPGPRAGGIPLGILWPYEEPYSAACLAPSWQAN